MSPLPPPTLVAFSAGLLTAGYLIAGVFFLSFWRRTRDGLFGAFAVAFWLMALNQMVPVALGIAREDQSPVFLLRLAAFLLIIFAVLRKNVGRGS